MEKSTQSKPAIRPEGKESIVDVYQLAILVECQLQSAREPYLRLTAFALYATNGLSGILLADESADVLRHESLRHSRSLCINLGPHAFPVELHLRTIGKDYIIGLSSHIGVLLYQSDGLAGEIRLNKSLGSLRQTLFCDRLVA